MRLNTSKALLLTGAVLVQLNTWAIAGQADNEFDASSTTPVTLDFTGSNWTQGGPGGWVGGTEVDGSINFGMAPVSGSGADVTVNGINSLFTGISSLTTSLGTATSSLTLEGSGGFLMEDLTGSGWVNISPSVALNLEIDVEVAAGNNLEINTALMSDTTNQSVNIGKNLTLNGPNSILRITHGGASTIGSAVSFLAGSTLDMNGRIEVGVSDVDNARLNIEEGATFNGAIDLAVAAKASVSIGTNALTFKSISGAGIIKNENSLSEVDLIVNGGGTSEFTGYLQIANDNSSLTVTGAGTTLILGAGEAGNEQANLSTSRIGQTRVTDGGTFLITPLVFGGQEVPVATLSTTLFIDGGIFGGEGIIDLENEAPDPNFQMISGWIQGGSRAGQGTLTFTGIPFGGIDGPITFDDDAGLMVYYDPTNPNVDSEGNQNAYINFAGVTAGIFFTPGANMQVNLIGQPDYFDPTANLDQWFSDGWQSFEGDLLVLRNDAGGSISDLTGGNWDATTNLATRIVTMSTDSGGPGLRQLYANIRADYAANAGQYQVIGNLLNALIPDAKSDPFGTDALLLTFVDRETFINGGEQAALLKTLQQNLTPQSALVANRLTANNMYFDVSRRNLKELAIGTRGPGMLKAGTGQAPLLMASQEEADAVSANSNTAPPRVIIQGTPNRTKPSSDVFQALFVEGYGRWDRMDQEGSVVGYKATNTGVATGWGIGLAEGVTVGLTAGWEHSSAELVEKLGSTKVNSFRGTPFISWSGISDGNEQYAMLMMGGAYNTANGVQESQLTVSNIAKEANFDINGWEFDMEGAVGARIPLSESIAIQPEASLRYSLLSYSGTLEPDGEPSTNYDGGDTSFINGRIGATTEWLISPTLRLSGSVGYQGQAINFGSTTYTLPANLGRVNLDFGSGNINQVYTGAQILWAPSWNTSFSLSYEGAYGDGDQNAVSGGVIIRF